MYKFGDKVRVIRGIRNSLPVGYEVVLRDDQPRGPNYIRVVNAMGGAAVYLADRFELVEAAPVVVPVVAPPVPPQEPHVFQAGDIVLLVAKVELPEIGWAADMDDFVNDGVEYEISAVDHLNKTVHVHGGHHWTWPFGCLQLVRVAGAAEPVPAAIIAPVAAPPAKQGPIAYEDVVPGMKAVFVGGGTAPHILDGHCKIGDVIEVIGHYGGGIPDAWSIKVEGIANPLGCYRDNFQHYNEAPKEIVVGSLVRCVEGYQDKLEEGEVYTVRSIGRDLISVQEVTGSYAKRRFVLSEAPPAPVVPEAPIPFAEVVNGNWAKIIDDVGLSDENEKKVGDGVYYQVSDVDRDDDTVLLKGCDWSWISVDALEFYKNKGVYVKPAPAVKPQLTLKERFIKKTNGKHHGGLASLAYETANGKQLVEVRAPCYRSFGYPGQPFKELLIGGIPMVEQVTAEGEGALEKFHVYAKYIMNDSPWADCFITKQVEDVIELNVNKTLSQVTGAAIVLRQGHEYYRYVPTFVHFLDKGYSGNVAFLMSMVTSLNNGEWVQTSMNGGHQAIESAAFKNILLTFFAKGFADYGDVPCTENTKDYSIYAAIQPRTRDGARKGEGDTFDQFAANSIEKLVVGQGWGAKTTLKEESVYAFADTLEKLIKEQQV